MHKTYRRSKNADHIKDNLDIDQTPDIVCPIKAIVMEKKIVVVNAGPRKGWNTDILLSEASDGAVSAGAEVRRFDLFRLENYTGCISCFGCKREKFKGHCICRDGLTPVQCD